MKTTGRMAVIFTAIALGSCGSSVTTAPAAKTEPAAPAAPVKPAIPPDIQKAADLALGSETEVLAYGDLSKSGPQEILAINRLKAAPPGVSAEGILLTRAVILENAGTSWKQTFLCGTPLAPVNGWRLQYEQHDKGLEMYFTPLMSPKGEGGHVLPVGIRWNPKVKRYQSLDRTFENFLGELPALETPESQIR